MRRRAGSRAVAAGGLSAWALAPLVATAVAVVGLVAASAVAAGGPAKAASDPLPVAGKPSIPAGEAVFGSRCAGCHGDGSRFTGTAWRKDVTPARVARIALGQAADHPASVTALKTAWQVTGYLWTLPDSGGDIRRGESLALQANDALRSDALGVVLFHWDALQNLKSGAWVLNHGEADVDRLMREVAGSKYTSLSSADRQDLIDYTFASFFEWPSGW
ncbi:MAG TPA: hypothetical protein VKA00_07135 [Trueperaceae bacterium]|nr:hypothetical protein [Trueperaceae bacterium]